MLSSVLLHKKVDLIRFGRTSECLAWNSEITQSCSGTPFLSLALAHLPPVRLVWPSRSASLYTKKNTHTLTNVRIRQSRSIFTLLNLASAVSAFQARGDVGPDLLRLLCVLMHRLAVFCNFSLDFHWYNTETTKQCCQMKI